MGACGSKEASRPVRQPAKTVQRTAKSQGTTTVKKAPVASTKAENIAKNTTKGKGIATSAASSNVKKSGIKSETRRLGTKDDDEHDMTAKTVAPVAAVSDLPKSEPKPEPEPVSVSRSTNTAREMAARAAESRLQQQKKGQLGKKLDAERKKNNKDYALEEYAAKAKT